MDKLLWKQVWLLVVILVGIAIYGVSISHGQVTQGTVFSKTEDGNGNKITSTVTGPSRGLDINCLAGCGGAASGALSTQDTGNSTLVTLGAGGNFTGVGFDLTNYQSWSISVDSNVNSAVNGWVVQWSEDNVNWNANDATTYTSGLADMASFGRKAKYVRLNYTNGGVAQATFRVYAWGHLFVRQTRHFIGQTLDDQDTGQIVTAAIQGHTTAGGGAWVAVKVNPSGALAADVTQNTSPWVVSGTVGVSNAFLLDATFTGRFPAALLDADAIVNETSTAIRGKCYLYNGATWDRCRGSIAGGMLVNISNASLAVTGSLGRTWTLSSATDSVTVNSSTVGTANNDGACPSGAANFTVAASNASRTWLAIWASPANTDDVYVKLGVTATNADARIAPGQAINFTSGRIYTGQVDAFPNSGTQAVCLMELN